MPDHGQGVERARELRQELTQLEKSVWARLRGRGRGGTKWRRQHPIGVYVVDFFCADALLVLELDGASHEFSQKRDAARDEYLRLAGNTVIRYSTTEFAKDFDGCLDAILGRVRDAAQTQVEARRKIL